MAATLNFTDFRDDPTLLDNMWRSWLVTIQNNTNRRNKTDNSALYVEICRQLKEKHPGVEAATLDRICNDPRVKRWAMTTRLSDSPVPPSRFLSELTDMKPDDKMMLYDSITEALLNIYNKKAPYYIKEVAVSTAPVEFNSTAYTPPGGGVELANISATGGARRRRRRTHSTRSRRHRRLTRRR